MNDLSVYVNLAAETGVYKDIELEILKETLLEWERRAGHSVLVELVSQGRLTGFAFFGPLSATEFTYDLKWLVVDRYARSRSIGSQLIERAEEEILRLKPNAIISVETCTRKENAVGIDFFRDEGFSLIGHIPNFYGAGDDYLMYAKNIYIRPAGRAEDTAGRAEDTAGRAEDTAGRAEDTAGSASSNASSTEAPAAPASGPDGDEGKPA